MPAPGPVTRTAFVVLTPHEEEDCFTVSTILRNLPQVDEFVVRVGLSADAGRQGLEPGCAAPAPGQKQGLHG